MNYHLIYISALSLLLTFGCANQGSSISEKREPRVWVEDSVTSEEYTHVINKVAFELKDPQSALFSDLWALNSSFGSRIFCGYVNGKNSYGAYVGMKMFVVYGTSVVFQGDGFVGNKLPRMCQPRTDYD